MTRALQTFPIQRAGSRAVLEYHALCNMVTIGEPGDLWALHQAAFEIRMSILQCMIREGYQPVEPDARIRVILEAERRGVSDVAGDIGNIDPRLHHLTVARYDATPLFDRL